MGDDALSSTLMFEYQFEDGSAVRVFKYGSPSTDQVLWVLGELMEQKKREIERPPARRESSDG